MVYFDHNATAPVLPAARQAWLEATDQWIGNPSSPHRVGARAETALTGAREKLAAWLECEPADLVWTSGATESNNMVLHHLSRTAAAQAEVWVSAIEHPCVLAAAARYFPQRCRSIPVQRTGVIDLDWLRDQLDQQRPAVVTVLAANNETGVLQPWPQLRDLCREREVPFFCDAAQWFGRLPAKGLGECDFVSGCAHKFGGPRGVGFLKCPRRGRFYPLLVGGQQEGGRRAGTENVAGVLALVAALEIRETDLAARGLGERPRWRQDFVRRLESMLPGTLIAGRDQMCLWNTVSAIMPPTNEPQRWVVKLDKLGFAVSTGSACASGREEPSHVWQAMGHSAAEAGRALRFSSGWETPQSDWKALLEALATVHAGMEPEATARP